MTLVTPFDCAFPRLVSVTSYLAIALLRTASLGILHSTVNERASGVMSTPLTSLVPTTARYCGGGALSAVLEVCDAARDQMPSPCALTPRDSGCVGQVIQVIVKHELHCPVRLSAMVPLHVEVAPPIVLHDTS